MWNRIKLVLLPSLVSAIVVQKVYTPSSTHDTVKAQEGNSRYDGSNYSAAMWSALVDRLQHDYSVAVYSRAHQVDETSLNIIWLPLLDVPTLGLLTDMGACYGAPTLPSLPLYAPHSRNALYPSVWRYTEVRGIKSHAWVEVTHTGLSNLAAQGGLPWFYVARGSGVSLNVGRTVVLDQTRSATYCDRRHSRHLVDLPECITEGLNLSALDSIQLLHVFDPGWDDKLGMQWEDGFRHEILLLRNDLLSEDEPLRVATRRGSTNSTGPAVKCGKWPHLFECDDDNQPLQYMNSEESGIGDVCSTEAWSALLWRCGSEHQFTRACR